MAAHAASTMCAVEMELACAESIDPSASGRALHAAFLSLLRTVDEPIATRLHEQAAPKPFSVALLASGSSGVQRAPASTMRVTSLDTGLTELLLSECVWRGRVMRIRNAEARIAAVTARSLSGTGGGPSSHEALLQEGRSRAGAGDRLSVRLRFLTATTFRMAETSLMMPLPWPRLVFQSLEQKWNAFASLGIWINWLEFDRRVSISRHSLRTEIVDLGSYRQVGFVGDVEFILHRDAPLNLIEAAHTLVLFARYGGVGAKTTMGMGVAVPLPLREPRVPAATAEERTRVESHRGGA